MVLETLCVLGFGLGAASLAHRPSRPGGWAWRNRLATTGIVAGCLAAFGLAVPENAARVPVQYLAVITLGYGHLLGAAVFGRGRASPRASVVPPTFAWALLGVTAGNAFVLYAWAGRSQPAVLLPLLAVSVWHIVENDLGLGRAYRRGLQLGPVGRGATEPFGSVGISALILALALAKISPEDLPAFGVGSPWTALGGAVCRVVGASCGVLLLCRRGGPIRLLGAVSVALAAVPPDMPGLSNASFGDLFTAVTLYHLVSWLVFATDRVRSSAAVDGMRRVRGLLWVHVPPAALCAGLLAWPAAEAAAVRQVVFSPAIYLFWSVLHVAQTAVARRERARAAPARQSLTAGVQSFRDGRAEEARESPP